MSTPVRNRIKAEPAVQTASVPKARLRGVPKPMPEIGPSRGRQAPVSEIPPPAPTPGGKRTPLIPPPTVKIRTAPAPPAPGSRIPVIGKHDIRGVGKVKIKGRAPTGKGYFVLSPNGDINYQDVSGVKVLVCTAMGKTDRMTDKRLIKLFKQGVVKA